MMSGDCARGGGGHGGPAAGEVAEPGAAVRVFAHGTCRRPQHDHRYTWMAVVAHAEELSHRAVYVRYSGSVLRLGFFVLVAEGG